MEKTPKPVRTTIVYGLIAALTFVPAVMASVRFFGWTLSIRLGLWCAIGAYGWLLAGWQTARRGQAGFALALLAGIAWVTPSNQLFTGFALVVLGWVRSGICARGGIAKRIAAETVTLGAAFLVAVVYQPVTPMEWAGWLWLFFILQAAYFVIHPLPASSADAPRDAFDSAFQAAEQMLVDVDSEGVSGLR